MLVRAPPRMAHSINATPLAPCLGPDLLPIGAFATDRRRDDVEFVALWVLQLRRHPDAEQAQRARTEAQLEQEMAQFTGQRWCGVSIARRPSTSVLASTTNIDPEQRLTNSVPLLGLGRYP